MTHSHLCFPKSFCLRSMRLMHRLTAVHSSVSRIRDEILNAL